MGKAELIESIKKVLQKHSEIELSILYGSVSENRETFESDLDIAVAGEKPISSKLKMQLIEDLALVSNRPVDLVDLQTTHGTLLKQILTEGSLIYKTSNSLYANIIKRMLFDDADFMPYYYRTLKRKRERWLNE
ncbi:MAG TPA: nucleotidyltransferase domain-containing protein [Balneolaceae bacterium]|nr:nucleotidyltransferase domain-containing protein [Balneolaceae bacterium]